MGMSDRIEAFILELMRQEQEDWVRLQRNELAQLFGCVPSQINYVISTRFSPERGYTVESHRGGGGCVKIRKAENRGLSAESAAKYISQLAKDGYITDREAEIINAATSISALGKDADSIRENILQCIMKVL